MDLNILMATNLVQATSLKYRRGGRGRGLKLIQCNVNKMVKIKGTFSRITEQNLFLLILKSKFSPELNDNNERFLTFKVLSYLLQVYCPLILLNVFLKLLLYLLSSGVSSMWLTYLNSNGSNYGSWVTIFMTYDNIRIYFNDQLKFNNIVNHLCLKQYCKRKLLLSLKLPRRFSCR